MTGDASGLWIGDGLVEHYGLVIPASGQYGNGAYLARLQARGAIVTGCDLSVGMLEASGGSSTGHRLASRK